MNKIIAIMTAIIALLLVNFNIWQKETHLTQGDLINLALAPVDPRSLMQGDYMTLRYAIENDIRDAGRASSTQGSSDTSARLLPALAYVVVSIDENNVANFVTTSSQYQLKPNERKLQYTVRNNKVKFASNAYFFAEGDEPIYRNAKYGQFRVNKKGEVLLTALLSDAFDVLGNE